MLTLRNYSVCADGKTILDDISHTFEAGKTHIVMGPNGSGKSTLALSLSGAGTFEAAEKSRAKLGKANLTNLSPEKRAEAGLFVSFQSPPAITGVSAFQMLRVALGGRMEAIKLKKKLEETADTLGMPRELLSRAINDGFSGGERKKMELLQMTVLDPSCAILDEIDTGVDIDAARTIAEFLKTWRTDAKTLIVITHRAALARELDADTVTVIKGGRIAETGGREIAERVEKEGYGESAKFKIPSSK